ncbi:MAG: hypothetical protein ACKPJO_22185 [Dolichospermum sp.]
MSCCWQAETLSPENIEALELLTAQDVMLLAMIICHIRRGTRRKKLLTAQDVMLLAIQPIFYYRLVRVP